MEVDVDHPVRGRVGFGGELADRHDPGVVDQDVERPEPLRDLVEEVGERVAARHVELEADRLGPELGRGLVGELAVEVADRDLGPLARQRGRGRLADSTGAARDRHDLATK